ncbi:MAG: sugar phosphate isomerase/epimerase [Acidobacteria bacterium]|nr:sugar phosphate isomerase/epimerase [Acidobacteriota bacterium]
MLSRRHLLASAFAAPLLHAATNKVRLGGPISRKSDDPRELAREHRRLGYSAAYCPDVELNDTARIKAIVDAFAAENVIIAEVGAWKNLQDGNPALRIANTQYVTDSLALAEAVGARCCVDITGSYSTKAWYGPHPGNLSQKFFDETVANARHIIDAVKPTRTKFAFEMMGWNLPDSADSYLKLLKAVDRKAFAVHVDVCNVINSPRRFYDNAAVTREIFHKLGRWIVSCHAKDLEFRPEMNVHFVEVIPGKGEIDYKAYLTAIAGLPKETPLMLEHLKSPAEYDQGAAYIRKVASECGVQLY